MHELSDILLLALCGILAHCETFEEIYDYAFDKEAALREFMALPAGIPSHDTLNRVFRHLDPVELERCLTQWVQALVELLVGRQLIIDGKQLRSTTVGGRRQASVQLVNMWPSSACAWPRPRWGLSAMNSLPCPGARPSGRRRERGQY